MALLLAGCAHRPFFVSPLGTVYTEPGISQDEAGKVEQYVFQRLVRDYGWPMKGVREALGQAYVETADLPAGTLGLTDGHVIQLAQVADRCRRRAALAHELLHEVGLHLGNPDREHRGRHWAIASPIAACGI